MVEQENTEFLTVKETCKLLGISRQALEGYVKRGLLTKHKRTLARRVYFDRAEVEELLRIK